MTIGTESREVDCTLVAPHRASYRSTRVGVEEPQSPIVVARHHAVAVGRDRDGFGERRRAIG